MAVDTAAVANAVGLGGASAVAMLCAFLYQRGAITPEELEMLRHSALQPFESIQFGSAGHNRETVECLEQGRLLLEAIWSKAATWQEG